MKRVVIRNICLIIIMIFGLGLVVQYTIIKSFKNPDEEQQIVEKVNPKISLVMVGDSLIHGAVYGDAASNGDYDFKPMLRIMKPIISSFDLAYYNQETILGGVELGLSSYPRFNSPYQVGDAFLDSGFNLVSLANNHTLDRGEVAINNSCNYWKEKDVMVSGSACSLEDRNNIQIKEIKGITYALLSYTTTTNGLNIPGGKTYYLNRYSEDVVKKDIESIRDKVDLLMVAMHFGEEYSFYPNYEQKNIAQYLSSLGVDIIIGSHPHVVEPIEYIDNTLVIYSLGNFLSAQRGIEKLTGLMVSVDITKDLDTNDILLDNVEAELLYTYSDYRNGGRSNFTVYPYTKLDETLLPNYQMYYNKYMEIVIGNNDFIKKGDYSGDIEQDS